MPGSLDGIKVIDLTRVLAGPVCTQILGDMGADVLKIERPGVGDDTRSWGPPFLKDARGVDTSESAYYLSANRNKRSVALDLSSEADRKKLHALLADADVLIENFKSGSLDKNGFGYTQLKDLYPKLVYCSITGFGHTGPMADEPGYDFMIQALSGFMSVTGPIDGPPSKAGVAIVDYVTGQNAAIAILAALQARTRNGTGQHIDLALFDSALAMMTNLAQYTLTVGTPPKRVGNAHTSIMPYNAFEASDGWIIIAIGNDQQFQKFAKIAGHPNWADDPRFTTNEDRVTHRNDLSALIIPVIATQTAQYWIDALMHNGVPCGPVNTLSQAFAMAQTTARNMVVTMQHPLSKDPIKLVGSPFKFSKTPVSYRLAPPLEGQHQKDIETL